MKRVEHHSLRKRAEPGMGRFLSLTNLDRYRRLADGEIAVAERSRLLKALSKEWCVFTRECGQVGTVRVGSLQEHVELRRQDGP